MTTRKIACRVIPPGADAAFAACMEDGRDLYAPPYDCRHPVLCRDDQPMPLWGETRPPIAGTRKHPRRVDDEYERAGTACLVLFREPLLG